MIWSDAWILLATIYAAREKPAPLDKVIGAADYIEHAVIEFEEMQGALARLVDAGFLTLSNQMLSPTSKTIEYYEKITKPRRRVCDVEKDIAEFIGASAWDPKQTPQMVNGGVTFTDLSRDEFDAAVKKYIEGMTSSKKKR